MSNTKILIVAPAWVGDLVMSLTLLNALKEINKDVTIDLLVNENLYDLAQCLPNVSKLIVSKTRHGKLSLFYRIKLGLKLREKNIQNATFSPTVLNHLLHPLSLK